MDFLKHREEGMVFYQLFLLSSKHGAVTELYCRNCKMLHKFKEVETSRQSCRGDCE
jgi:hypothetical protein